MKFKSSIILFAALSCTISTTQASNGVPVTPRSQSISVEENTSHVTQVKPKHDWAKTTRYEKDNQALKKRPYAVFMGNSITDNWSNRVHPEFFEENNFVGRGISGQTSAEMLVRFRSDVLELRPKVVVILAGTNDVAMNNGYISHENVVRNIASMCDLAKANKIKVVLCSVIPATQFRWIPSIDPKQKIVELNAMIKAYADAHHILYLDYHSAMKDEHNGLRANLTKDGCHPVMAGYEIMEKMILENIKKAKLPK